MPLLRGSNTWQLEIAIIICRPAGAKQNSGYLNFQPMMSFGEAAYL